MSGVEMMDRLERAADNGAIRQFDTGATRDTAQNKLDYEGFLSPDVLVRFAEYMHRNRQQRDGSLRASDNWQKGIPISVYMKSMFRHFMAVWSGYRHRKDVSEDLCALLFNVMGMLHEVLKIQAFADEHGAEVLAMARQSDKELMA